MWFQEDFSLFPKLKSILVYLIFINYSLCFKKIVSTFYIIFQKVDEKTMTIKIATIY